MRHLDNILRDFDAGCSGSADIDMRAILWEIIADVTDSYAKAMKSAYISIATQKEITDTVDAYLVHHYGDN